ncbi:CpsD/CapB family tyrosine-protein kinase [Candidatus Omnitrophota bacterium]
MGKITNALKKVERQREIEKLAWRDKNKAQPAMDESKDKASGKEKRFDTSGATQKKSRHIERKGTFRTWKEGIQYLKDRLESRFYVAKASDDSGIDPRVVTYYDPAAHISEQYRILRTNIHSKALTKTARTFLVSSAFHSEGKTVTSVNLAVALAQDLDKKVLLIDCDLRRGNVHKLLNLDSSPGLSDILADCAAPEVVLRTSRINNLTVITRGKIPFTPSELLSSRMMRRLLEELKSRFDYIIIDSTPVIPLTDAGILGAQCDGVIFVVQAQKTQEQAVARAQELLEHAHAKISGFVLTQTDYFVPGYYSHYLSNNGKE